MESLLVRRQDALSLAKPPKNVPPLGERSVYEPLLKTGLFLRLAMVDPTIAGILEFVDEFGNLGGGVGKNVPALQTGQAGLVSTEIYSEPLGIWHLELLELRQAIGDAIAHGLLQVEELGADVLAKFKGHIPWSTASAPGEATRLLRNMTNRRLATIAPQLSLSADGIAHVVEFVPRSLRDVIWLQFAAAASEGRGIRYKPCGKCGIPFKLGGGSSRGNKRKSADYCSDKCRIAQWESTHRRNRTRGKRG